MVRTVLPVGASLSEPRPSTLPEALQQAWDLLTVSAVQPFRPVEERVLTPVALPYGGTVTFVDVTGGPPPVWRVAQRRNKHHTDRLRALTGYDVHVVRRLSGRRTWHIALVTDWAAVPPRPADGWTAWESGEHFVERLAPEGVAGPGA